MSCHLEIPLEFSDNSECPALSAAEAPADDAEPRAGSAPDSARSFPRLRFWPDATVLAPAANGPNDAAWGSAPRLPVPAFIAIGSICSFGTKLNVAFFDVRVFPGAGLLFYLYDNSELT